MKLIITEAMTVNKDQVKELYDNDLSVLKTYWENESFSGQKDLFSQKYSSIFDDAQVDEVFDALDSDFYAIVQQALDKIREELGNLPAHKGKLKLLQDLL